ncbi:MAG: FtsX-like permease family protein [Myxococcota bacterium]
MLFLIAFRNLIQARRRTALLGVALGAVTTLFVLLLSLSAGLRETMIRSATTLASGHVNIGGFFKARRSNASPVIGGVAALRAIVKRELDHVEHVVDRARGFARIVSPESSMQVGLTGIDVDEEARLLSSIQLAKQSEYLKGGADVVLGNPQDLALDRGALIFAAQARRLGVDIGDPLTIIAETREGQRNSEEVVVMAIARDLGFLSNLSMFVPKSVVRRLYRLGPDVSGVVQIYLDSHQRSAAAMKELRVHLEAAGHRLLRSDSRPFFAKFSTVAGQAWTGQRLDVTSWQDEFAFLSWILTAVDSTSVALVSVLLVIIAAGIINSMWISVRERTAEIGTLRAIGMSRGQVLTLFVLEALMLGALSTGFGALLGSTLALLIDASHLAVPIDAFRAILMSDTLHLVVKPVDLMTTVAAFSLLTGICALWPAARAARLAPVKAIHRT